MEGIRKMPKTETLGKGIVPPSKRNSPIPNFKILCHTSTPLTALQHNGGIQATHTPTSYKELQRNKVLFSKRPFPASLLQPHWTSSTNSHV